MLIARAPLGVMEALIAHAARRARGAGRVAVVAKARAGAPLWHEVAVRLASPLTTSNPAKCAEQIATAALLQRALIVAPLPVDGSWDRAVAAELAALATAPSILFVGDGSDGTLDLGSETFDVPATLDETERRRWWSAVAHEAHSAVATNDFGGLESWWAAARRAAVATPVHPEDVPSEGHALFIALALAGRPWPLGEIAVLDAHVEGISALAAAGAVTISSGWVAIATAWEGHAAVAAASAPTSLREGVATALLGASGFEPWAYAHAAELLLHAAATPESIELADQAHVRTIASVDDPLARREIVARWLDEVEALSGTGQRQLFLRAAERALAAGEPDEAMRSLRSAGAGAEDSQTLLLQGRASAALGDMVAARVALERARRCADDVEVGLLAFVELAEVAYMLGDIATARENAEAGVAGTACPATALKGRNVLGKLLLAESKWDEADRHFAEDGLLAVEQKDPVAELRALLNRGIALLSKGLSDQAYSIFQKVLVEGERQNEPRASAYALSNLAHLATQRHDYGAALEYWERAIKLLHAMRDRFAAARILANLAAVRRLLGLLDHAEHALSFGRRVLGAGVTSGSASQFDIEAAQIALARGQTLEAQRQIDAAIRKAASDRDLLCRAHSVGARIALEDGDLPRAELHLTLARELATKPTARAEIMLLQARYERAAGGEDIEPAKLALSMARTAGDDQLLSEAHVLLAELLRASGDIAECRTHVNQALRLRDRFLERIPSDLRPAFLAKPDVVHLGRLFAQITAQGDGSRVDRPLETEETSRSMAAVRTVPSPAREIIGDDPAIRGLRTAIRKVARSSSTVLIRGESGTGKELVAEALHRASERANGPLITVNCAALVETLLLSELFGHEKGAFTGAFARRRGRFELAEGGTLFLDEIGDISARTQVALLRVLQERTFERVGGTTPIRANVRIVCATHRDLRAMVERGDFREDLYYRLRGITLEMPPLRARAGDICHISEHLLARIAAERGERAKELAPDALELLCRHRWPGNVRELENALRVASLFAESGTVGAADFVENVDDLRSLGGPIMPPPGAVSSSPSVESETTLSDIDAPESDSPLPQIEANATSIAYAQVRQGVVSLSDMKRQIERDCIARALAETKGNITRAAALLGMKRPRLSQRVKQYGLAAVSSEGSG